MQHNDHSLHIGLVGVKGGCVVWTIKVREVLACLPRDGCGEKGLLLGTLFIAEHDRAQSAPVATRLGVVGDGTF